MDWRIAVLIGFIAGFVIASTTVLAVSSLSDSQNLMRFYDPIF